MQFSSVNSAIKFLIFSYLGITSVPSQLDCSAKVVASLTEESFLYFLRHVSGEQVKINTDEKRNWAERSNFLALKSVHGCFVMGFIWVFKQISRSLLKRPLFTALLAVDWKERSWPNLVAAVCPHGLCLKSLCPIGAFGNMLAWQQLCLKEGRTGEVWMLQVCFKQVGHVVFIATSQISLALRWVPFSSSAT